MQKSLHYTNILRDGIKGDDHLSRNKTRGSSLLCRRRIETAVTILHLNAIARLNLRTLRACIAFNCNTIRLLRVLRYYFHRKWSVLKKLNIKHDPATILKLGNTLDIFGKVLDVVFLSLIVPRSLFTRRLIPIGVVTADGDSTQ